MISSIIAMAFRKHEVSISSEPEIIRRGLERFTLHHNGRDVNVLVVYSKDSISSVNEFINGSTLVVNLTDEEVHGKVIPREKLDVLLSRVGLDTESLKILSRYRTVAILPSKSPLNFVKEAMGDQRLILSFILPLMYPYLVFDVSYKKLKKGFFSKKIVQYSGKTIIDLTAVSYCLFGKKTGLACDRYVRSIPATDEEIEYIKHAKDIELSVLTPEGLARQKKIPIDKAEDFLMKLETIGFAVRKGQRAFFITRILPPITDGDSFIKLGKEESVPIDWSYFPFMCIKDLPRRISGIISFLKSITDKVSENPTIVLYPYIVMGFTRGGRKQLYVYDVLAKRFEERIVDVIKTHRMEDCLYILSKS